MHECPECYAGCMCRGDINDTLLAAFGGCSHCDPIGVEYGPDIEDEEMDATCAGCEIEHAGAFGHGQHSCGRQNQ